MRTPARLNSLTNFLNSSDFHVAVITETWLESRLTFKLEGIHVAQTPSAAHQGVMILARKPVLDLQPIFPESWTPHTLAVVARTQDQHGKWICYYVVGHYS